MEKEVLAQYVDLREEIRELRIRISQIEKVLAKMEEKGYQVKDSVKGTRPDGTIGSIMIAGFPYPEYARKKNLLRRETELLHSEEERLLELTNQVETFIEGIKDSRVRRIFRYRYLDGYNWAQVACRMGGKHTADSCRMAHNNFFCSSQK